MKFKTVKMALQMSIIKVLHLHNQIYMTIYLDNINTITNGPSSIRFDFPAPISRIFDKKVVYPYSKVLYM